MPNPFEVALLQPGDAATAAESLSAAMDALGSMTPARRIDRLADWIQSARKNLDRATLVGTGEGWGGNIQSLERTARVLIMESQSSLHLTIYSITEGASQLLSDLEEVISVRSKLTVHLLINRPGEQKQPSMDRLRQMAVDHPHRVFLRGLTPSRGELHAKVLVSDRRRAIVGSANLSFNGLNLSRELGVLLEGPRAWELGDMVERLCLEPGAKDLTHE